MDRTSFLDILSSCEISFEEAAVSLSTAIRADFYRYSARGQHVATKNGRRREHVTALGLDQWLGGPRRAGDQWRPGPVAGRSTTGAGGTAAAAFARRARADALRWRRRCRQSRTRGPRGPVHVPRSRTHRTRRSFSRFIFARVCYSGTSLVVVPFCFCFWNETDPARTRRYRCSYVFIRICRRRRSRTGNVKRPQSNRRVHPNRSGFRFSFPFVSPTVKLDFQANSSNMFTRYLFFTLFPVDVFCFVFVFFWSSRIIHSCVYLFGYHALGRASSTIALALSHERQVSSFNVMYVSNPFLHVLVLPFVIYPWVPTEIPHSIHNYYSYSEDIILVDCIYNKRESSFTKHFFLSL